MGVPVGNRTPRGTSATHYPARLRTTPQVCQRASSPRHVDEQRAELGGWGRGFLVNVCHLFMDQWMSFGDRELSDRALLAELWRVFPPQPNEPAFPAVYLRGLFCQSRSSSGIILMRSLVFQLSSSGRPAARQDTPGRGPVFS